MVMTALRPDRQVETLALARRFMQGCPTPAAHFNRSRGGAPG